MDAEPTNNRNGAAARRPLPATSEASDVGPLVAALERLIPIAAQHLGPIVETTMKSQLEACRVQAESTSMAAELRHSYYVKESEYREKERIRNHWNARIFVGLSLMSIVFAAVFLLVTGREQIGLQLLGGLVITGGAFGAGTAFNPKTIPAKKTQVGDGSSAQ